MSNLICIDEDEPRHTPAEREIDNFILSQIGGGFTAEVYAEHGVNASQVTQVAQIIAWLARTEGSIKATVEAVTAAAIGHPQNGLMDYQVNGVSVPVYEWLDAIRELLEQRFAAKFATSKANE
jgi:hypothetical protein